MPCTQAKRRLLVLAAGLILLPVAGADTPATAAPPTHEAARTYAHHFDWIEHTRSTLAELKTKLNLAPTQQAAWETWSAGVVKDAHEQLEARKSWLEESAPGAKPAGGGTTPDRMARGIERLRAENEWMQRHIVQLEGALERTRTFYAVLDANQRTIFDMFWHEMFHRVGGMPGGPESPWTHEDRHAEHCRPER